MYPYYHLYSQWRDHNRVSLHSIPETVVISNLVNMTSNELGLINNQLEMFNYAVYDSSQSSFDFDQVLSQFAEQLGLFELDQHHCVEEDKITKIFDNTDKSKSLYIPYTNKPINWHTDGYYNPQDQIVYSFILHCENPAFEGGVNGLLDQDQVFIYLMSQNPLYIDALMQSDVMTVPENRQDGILIRPETSTAIFAVINNHHDVLMRYSMRKRNIVFKQDFLTLEALACMDEFINSDSSPHDNIKLKAGQGVICNNVLHKRTSFKDKLGSERLYYRARFYNRVSIK